MSAVVFCEKGREKKRRKDGQVVAVLCVVTGMTDYKLVAWTVPEYITRLTRKVADSNRIESNRR